ncbi:MAG TPA: hypothetical protein VHR47_00265 [Bacillota bacterium]|nr:hypothetical protein [Bacillota bacterium]
MKMKTAPENKTFLYVIIGLIFLLLGYRFLPALFFNPSQESDEVPFEEVKSVVGKELSIRQRHMQIKRALGCWNGHFLIGTKREVELVIMKKVEFWTGTCGFIYDSTQIATADSKDDVKLELRGSAPYPTIRKFLRCVEQAPFAITVSSIHLKQEEGGERLHYELTLTAPVRRGDW